MPHLVPRPTILQTAESILRIQRSKWIYHERALAKSLGLSIEILRGFVKSIGSGGGPPPYDAAIDLNSGEDNILNLYRLQHGKKMTHAVDSEEPSLDHAVTGLNTYYQIGRKETRDKRINIKVQIDLIKMVTGTHAALDQFGGEYKTKRQEIWKDWVEGSNPVTSALYEHDHLPYIVLHYYRYWDVTIPPNTTVTALSSAVLELVKQEIVDLLVKMFVIPSSAMEQFTVLRRSTRNSVDMEIEPTNSRKRKHSPVSEDNSTSLDDDGDDDDDEETESGADGNEDLTKAMSKQLDRGELKQLWMDGEYKRVGCLEIAAKEAHAGNDLPAANSKITMLGGTAISIAEFDAIKSIKKSILGRKIKNFVDLKEHINSGLPGDLFHIGKNQLVLEYVNHGLRYTKTSGECLSQEIHFISKHNNQKELRLDCAHMIRHIIICYDISLSKFAGLLNCFGCLLFGRPLRDDEFPSTSTIRLHIPRLTTIDRYFAALVDKETFGYTTKHGFAVLWYLITDDTVHLSKRKHHGVIRTGRYGEDDDDSNDTDIMERQPRFITLTSSSAVGTDAEANADLNMKVMLEEIHRDVLPFLGGGTVDGAGSARKEIIDTMDKLIAYCKENEIDYIRYGVVPRSIIIQDFFHIDNVAINGASVIFSGDSERGNSRQFHPLQLCQSIHDVHSVDPVISQNIVNKLLAGTGKTYKLKTNRERPQRWRVNGLFALRIIEMMGITLADGNNLLTSWAIEMHLIGGKVAGADCQWMKQTASEIAVMSQSAAIKISLAFEAELVSNYFDITHADHARKGEFQSRSGFVTMGLPFLLLNFVVPFWRGAKDKPKEYFPRTGALIDELEDEELKKLKMEQLEAAIECGLEKVSKNTEQFFKAPLIFLLLPHPVEGPRILRMMVRIFKWDSELDSDSGRPAFDVDDDYIENEHDHVDIEREEGWGDWRHSNGTWPKEEKVWYDILSSDKETIADLVHYWQQLGLQRNCVRAELMKLSKIVVPTRDPYSKHPLKDFKEEFPIIYEALSAPFCFSASNSRIVEMLHSFARQCVREQTPIEFLASKMRYLIDNEYQNRKDRRDIFKERADPTKRRQKAKHLDRKETQQMEGEQLMNSSMKYSQSILEELPDELKEECKIRNIANRGVRNAEKEYEEATNQAWEEKRTKKLQRTSLLTLDAITAEANKLKTNHDIQWQDREARKMNEVTKTVATKTHFNKVKAGDQFYNEVINVLPHIGKSLVELKKMNKTAMMKKGGIVGEHLDLIKKIAKDPSLNNLTNDDLSEKSEDEILKYFVLANNSSLLGDIQKKIDDHRKLLHSVFSVAAKQISPFYKKLLDKSSTHGNDEMWGSGEDANTPTDTDADAGADADADADENTTNNTVADEDANNHNNT